MTPATRSLPLVIAHRGACGYRPEHTRAAYELAVGMGADYIEPDLVMTSDGVLVVRHEPEIGGTTDIAGQPRFADRETTREVDGTPVTGWFVEDLTLAELRTLRARERLPDLRPGSQGHDGRFEVLTFEQVLHLREELSRHAGRVIGVIPEIKHPSHLHAAGFDPEAEVLRLLERHGLNHDAAPVWVQCFELTALQRLRGLGYRGRSTFLTSGPSAPARLDGLAEWVDGISPEKDAVIPRTADGALGTPTTLVADAHAADLLVTPWTFRAENVFLPTDLRVGDEPGTPGRLADEITRFLDAGIDGLFVDHPDVAVAARLSTFGDTGARPVTP